jgi:hypothetical protein
MTQFHSVILQTALLDRHQIKVKKKRNPPTLYRIFSMDCSWVLGTLR